MSTDEKERQIGRAFLDRKEALQTMKCLRLKVARWNQVFQFLSLASAKADGFRVVEPDDVEAYPSKDDLLALVAEMRSVQQEIVRLDDELG